MYYPQESRVRAQKGPSMSSQIQKRIDSLHWIKAGESLSARGYAVTDQILTPEECSSIVSLYNEPARFRSQVIMERHRFGLGDYKYFANPLPELVTDLRSAAYPHLSKIANEWAKAFGEKKPLFPLDHAEFLKICHKGGQTKPTPLDRSSGTRRDREEIEASFRR